MGIDTAHRPAPAHRARSGEGRPGPGRSHAVERRSSRRRARCPHWPWWSPRRRCRTAGLSVADAAPPGSEQGPGTVRPDDRAMGRAAAPAGEPRRVAARPGSADVPDRPVEGSPGGPTRLREICPPGTWPGAGITRTGGQCKQRGSTPTTVTPAKWTGPSTNGLAWSRTASWSQAGGVAFAEVVRFRAASK